MAVEYAHTQDGPVRMEPSILQMPGPGGVEIQYSDGFRERIICDGWNIEDGWLWFTRKISPVFHTKIGVCDETIVAGLPEFQVRMIRVVDSAQSPTN